MAACCNCCTALKPKYKRYVDNIFPADPQDGLVKANMDTLMFFAMKSPEKLDRIGDYLAQRLYRDVTRQRTGYCMIAMEALDNLLVNCHAQALNLFVESFLKMVQKLLEGNQPDLQCRAAQSFVKFANIEEITPSYHRRYDFFVSKFSAMCHSNSGSTDINDKIRTAGLNGIQGIIRKTANDDLQINIWDSQYTNKILPSLLFNMQNHLDESYELDSPTNSGKPHNIAQTIFRDLICSASYGNINSVIRPVLTHLDNHKLWNPNTFAVKCFKIIMFAIQSQYSYMVIQMLISHLDENSKKDPLVKKGIIIVLYETVLIAAGGCMGSSVLDIFNTLLRHLRISVDTGSESKVAEEEFQEALMNTIGEFANNLPDYQKIEILIFVIGKVPMNTDNKNVEVQKKLLRTLLIVATKYRTTLMVNAFPNFFLDPLLKISLSEDPSVRKLIQEILHTLLDRHDNINKLKDVKVFDQSDSSELTVEKASRQDIMFMKKNGPIIYQHIYENINRTNNRVDNFESLFTTIALICVEMASDEIYPELLNFILGIQLDAISWQLQITHKAAIHALIASFLSLVSHLTAIPAFSQHVHSVIESRRLLAPFYLPTVAFNRGNTADSYPLQDFIKEDWKFNVQIITDALTINGIDTSCLSTPYNPCSFRRDSIEKAAGSMSDVHSISDLESATSTPSPEHKEFKEHITFQSLKKILEHDPQAVEEKALQKRKVVESFRFDHFDDICARTNEISQQYQNTLCNILDMLVQPQTSPGGTPQKSLIDRDTRSVYEMQFPELFVY